MQHLFRLVTIQLEKQKLFRENIRLNHQTERDSDLLKKNLVELSIIFNFTKNLAYNFDVTEICASIFESISEAVYIDLCSILDIKRKTITVKSYGKLEPNTLEQLKEILLAKAGASLDGKSVTFESSLKMKNCSLMKQFLKAILYSSNLTSFSMLCEARGLKCSLL